MPEPQSPVSELRVALTAPSTTPRWRSIAMRSGCPSCWTGTSRPAAARCWPPAGRRSSYQSPQQAGYIDEVEVGRRVAGPVQLALEVEDSAATADALVARGAERLGETVVTPWNDRNARLRAPDGMRRRSSRCWARAS